MKIIQFLHPGAEHSCNSGSAWNEGNHKRKYIEILGHYLQNLESEPKESKPLYFWGEWEAQSNCREIQNPVVNGPNYIFNPYYQLPLPINAANTDPFIFGDQFYYCICKQAHYTCLRDLEPGDVLLFGSCKNRQFVLDTVFVVKNKRQYKFSRLSQLRNDFNKTFSEISLLPLEQLVSIEQKKIIEHDNICIPLESDDESDYCTSNSEDTYFIYEAVMYRDRNDFQGMFSYAPCLTNEEEGRNGFARPVIDIPEIISPTLNQGLMKTDVEDSTYFWECVTKKVLDLNLALMTENQI